MHVTVRTTVADASRWLTDVQKKQIPFATMLALNDSLFFARASAQSGMQRDLDRPTPGTLRGVQVERATKRNESTAAVLIEHGRFERFMRRQVYGGTRVGAWLIAQDSVPRDSYGNVRGQKGLRRRLLAQPRHFEIHTGRTPGIYKRTGSKRGSIELVALRAARAQYAVRFKFREHVDQAVGKVFPEAFRRRLVKALATAR